MNIAGLQKTTLLDYPGHVAATIFLGGCNFRCPFCHNMNIVTQPEQAYSEEEIIKFLSKRANVLDGVCITGGEPTIYNDLLAFIRNIKGIKRADGGTLLVKLDTNGTNPTMLKDLISLKLIDYVAMDIKSSLDKYSDAAGIDGDESTIKEVINNIKESVDILKRSSIDYEFRTTIVDKYHTKEDMEQIGELIRGAKKYFIQSFIDSEYVIDHTLMAIDKEKLVQYEELMKQYVYYVLLRGVD